MATTSTRAANGDMVYLESADDAVALDEHPWFGHVRFTPRYGQRVSTPDLWGLDLAPVASLQSGVESVGGRVRERFSLAGGQVVIVDCADPEDARWAAWMGPWHMAHGMFYAPQWESADIVDTFTRVRWVDTPEGLTADPGDRFDLSTVMCLISVTGVGALQVEPKRLAVGRTPRWRGARVPTGEVWQLPAGGDGSSPALLHVTGSAVTTVMPDDVPAPAALVPTGVPGAGTPERAVAFLRSVRRLDCVA
jgi:hypothetical protein